jgi:hypothetical protein
MATDYSATIRAFPFFSLLFQEFVYAIFLNEAEIVNETHVIERAIPFVKMFQVSTGEFVAFITVFHLLVPQQIASFLEKGAFLFSRTTPRTVGHSDTFSFNIMFQSKIATANSTIHTARCNQFFPQIARTPTFHG